MPLPDTPFYRLMKRGHLIRVGHVLKADLVSDDGSIWRIRRECCDA